MKQPNLQCQFKEDKKMTTKREAYLEIKNNYNQFIEAWKTNNSDLLEGIVANEVACNLSTVAKYPCGCQHGIIGMKDFINKQPESDFFYITPCNFVLRIKDDVAQQSAILVGKVGKYHDDNVLIEEFSALNVNSWRKVNDQWKIVEFKMDIQECTGNYDEFVKNWYFENVDLKYYHGIHLPVISGELDSPWVRIPKEDDVKTDEEKILETFSQYAFGIDTLAFNNLDQALSDDIIVNMAPWNSMDKRLFMETLKFKRQASFYWNHPVMLDSILINGNNANLKLYRMAGHKQSAIPILYTKENAETCYADARYEIKLKKENNQWKVTYLYYYLGTINLGSYNVKL